VVRRVLVATIVVAIGCFGFAGGAGASVSSSPRRTAGFNDRVRVAVVSGNTIYVGGHFTRATDLNGQVVTRNRVAAVNATTGALLPWNPNANRAVYTLAVAGGTVYLGGDFSTVGGASRSRLAAVDGGSGAVLAWNHRADDRVRALAASSTRLYAGGDFTGIDGTTRTRLAAFSLSGGGLDAAWTPSADDTVYTLEVGLSQTRVYVGGAFPRLNGETAHGYAGALNASSGAIDTAFRGRVRYTIRAIVSTADSVYAAGDGSGGHLVAWDTAGAIKFPTVQTDGGAQAVAVLGGEVYVGGHWDYVCPNGVSQTTGGSFDCQGTAVTRRKLLSVDEDTGQLTAWAPVANSPLGVFTLTPTSGGLLVAGGDFTRVNQVAHSRLTRFG
jgi:hypothetical protein